MEKADPIKTFLSEKRVTVLLIYLATMKKIFPYPSEPANTDVALKLLSKKFPDLSSEYINLHMRQDWSKAKEYFESVWHDFNTFADADFHTEIQKKFAERAWELYLFDALRKSNFELVKQRKQQSNPDFRVNLGSRALFVEAVLAGKGTGSNTVTTISDRLQRVPSGTVVSSGGSFDELNQPKVRRILSALDSKKDKYILRPGDAYVIAVSGAEIDGNMMNEALILEAVMGINPAINIPIYPDRTSGPAYHTTRFQIPNSRNTESIDTGVFLHENYRKVSAVIYFGRDIVNAVLQDAEQDEIVLVHNPHVVASGRLNLDAFPNFTQITFTSTHWTRHLPQKSRASKGSHL